MSDLKWLPLKSDPYVMNLLLKNLGVSDKCKVSDILSLDEEYLQSFVSPILGVVLLFPVPENYANICEDERKLAESAPKEIDPDVYFMHQTIKYACGPMAMIHVIANNMKSLQFEKESAVQNFIEKTRAMTPQEKAQELGKNEKIKDIVEATAWQGQGDTTSFEDVENSAQNQVHDEASNHHYIAFVNVNSNLYELDGYKYVPVHHGSTSKDTFLTDAARICKNYIKRDPSKLNFSALVLTGV